MTSIPRFRKKQIVLLTTNVGDDLKGYIHDINENNEFIIYLLKDKYTYPFEFLSADEQSDIRELSQTLDEPKIYMNQITLKMTQNGDITVVSPEKITVSEIKPVLKKRGGTRRKRTLHSRKTRQRRKSLSRK